MKCWNARVDGHNLEPWNSTKLHCRLVEKNLCLAVRATVVAYESTEKLFHNLYCGNKSIQEKRYGAFCKCPFVTYNVLRSRQTKKHLTEMHQRAKWFLDANASSPLRPLKLSAHIPRPTPPPQPRMRSILKGKPECRLPSVGPFSDIQWPPIVSKASKRVSSI